MKDSFATPSPLRIVVSLVALLVPSGLVMAFSGVGLPWGQLQRSVIGRVHRGDGSRLTIVPHGRPFEVLPLWEGAQRAVFLWNDVLVWLNENEILPAVRGGSLNRDELAVGVADTMFRPIRDLPRGMTYAWLYKAGAKLHVCVIDFGENPALELVPHVAPFFDRQTSGEARRAPVLEVARRFGAVVGLNGTFFATGGGQAFGEPLGNVIIGGQVAYELTRSDVLARSRSYVATTTAGRLIMGETDLAAGRILEKIEAGEFDVLRFAPDERIASLMGGMGWLVQDGRIDGWIDGLERQFGIRYYSGRTRRPQSVLGICRDGRILTIVAQEGWPHGQRRLTLPELAVVIHSLGCHDAVFTDGGGSTELVVQGRAVVRPEGLGTRRAVSTALLVREADQLPQR